MCKDDCTTAFDTCVQNGGNKCNKKKNRCNNDCDQTSKCGDECEDNKIPGFGSFWCELNTNLDLVSESAKEEFCNNEHFKSKCMLTCGECVP